ncbi:MAG TPA: TIGR04086 family membrane protein [Candidatus Krumholzibacteria bacterium]
MKEEYVVTETTNGRAFFGRYVSWSAIAAGLVVALVMQILLTMLGVAIGAATIQPLEERNPVEGLGTGASIWWFVTALISLFVGAFVAGRLSHTARKKTGALHGFLMWGTATVFTFMVAGTMLGGMFATGFSAISQPGNRHELKNQYEMNRDRLGIGDQSRNDNDADYSSRNDTNTDYDEVNRAGSDIRPSPATPYTYDAQGTNRIDGRTPATGNGTERDINLASRNARDTMETRGSTNIDSASSPTMGSVDSDNDRAAGNTNLLNRDENDGQYADEDKPVVGSVEEARAREVGEEAADTTAKAALIGLVVLLIGAGTCTWAGSKGVPNEYVPPTGHDVRVTGGIPGEPVKG